GTWTDLIAGATLVGDNGDTKNNYNVAINSNNIAFTNIDRDVDGGHTELGEIANGSDKVYTLAIWLKSPLSGGLQSTVDNLHIGLAVATTTGIVTDSDGSGMQTGQTVTSNDNGTNGKIDVVATAIRITQDPSTAAIQSIPLTTQ